MTKKKKMAIEAPNLALQAITSDQRDEASTLFLKVAEELPSDKQFDKK